MVECCYEKMWREVEDSDKFRNGGMAFHGTLITGHQLLSVDS